MRGESGKWNDQQGLGHLRWQRTICLRKPSAAWIRDPMVVELPSETTLCGSCFASAVEGTRAFNLEHSPVV